MDPSMHWAGGDVYLNNEHALGRRGMCIPACIGQGGCIPACIGKGVYAQCMLGYTPPPVNRITDRCKNITFPQLRLQTVMIKR